MAVSWTAVSSYAPISNIADGTVNTILAAVKAASTAATTSDPALVVTESPNGTTPDTATGAFAAIKSYDAPFMTSVPMTAGAAAITAGRSWWVYCPANASAVLTFTLAAVGTTTPTTGTLQTLVTTGGQGQPWSVVSYVINSGSTTCTVSNLP